MDDNWLSDVERRLCIVCRGIVVLELSIFEGGCLVGLPAEGKGTIWRDALEFVLFGHLGSEVMTAA